MAPTFCKGCICIRGILQCNCGEDREDFRWCWLNSDRTTNLRISDNNKDILFHPLYSCGTAVVRGVRPFEQNMHHYWEIKIMSKMYGTDVMIGVGTAKTVLAAWQYRFDSMLGKDSESWGYSYRGGIQHNNMIRKYGTKFGQGTLVGVHMNMYNGTLEYHINRKPVGIAFTNLRDRILYPMISSTAAQSSVRIVCSVSEESTLQMKCLQVISKYPALYKKYKDIPGLAWTYEKKYFWIVPTDEEGEKKKRLAELEYRLDCPFYKGKFMKRKNNGCTIIHHLPPYEEITHYDDDTFLSVDELDSSDEDLVQSSSLNHNENTVDELIHLSKQDCDDSNIKMPRLDISDDTISVYDFT